MRGLLKIFCNVKLAVVFRLLVGGVFVFSGFTKLMFPPEEFAELIRGYQLVPQALIDPLSLVIPWIELISGAFFLLGLFTRVAAVVVAVELVGFMVILSYVLAKGINLEDCGCFSAIGIKETPLQALIRDAVLFLMTIISTLCGGAAYSLDALLTNGDQE